MAANTVRGITEQEWGRLVACAKGKTEPDLVVQGGTVLNVYSGELMEANLWVVGNRIAYLGPRVYEGTQAQVIDATGKVVTPGYIEPHAHPFQLYNPMRYAETILARGTTLSVNDNLMLVLGMEFGQVGRFFEQMAQLPIKMMWSLRLDPQAHLPEKKHKFDHLPVSRLLKSPYVWQVGEVTDWKSWIDGDEAMRDNALSARAIHKRVEGHAAGVSWETLNVLVAAGITADHEAINAEEALRRLRLGVWTTLRHSSLRPDFPAILPELIPQVKNWSRVMMTTDGPTPEYLQNGYTDFLIRHAIELGMDPITAYQLVTINPATYYGVDGEIGGLAPGRIADILLLSNLLEPTPELVIAEGRIVAKDGELVEQLKGPTWADVGMPPVHKMDVPVDPAWFDVYTEADTFPVMRLANPAITRHVEMPVEKDASGRVVGLVENSEDLCYVSLLQRGGAWVCNGFIQNFSTQLAGLASSYTGAREHLVIGRDKTAMAAALERVQEIGGGIVIVDEQHNVLYELPLVIGGAMGDQTVEELVQSSKELVRVLKALGHPHYDPVYTLLFLSSAHLPEVRLSSVGLFEMKTKRVLHPSRSLR
ncbi:adenine deaminase C-terminal domain-containing protein [Tumebacillus permanentifrigoris]|uniref:adenine deaminase n=1 Tax=Tumebacillus permanentifrigoris TaxID=378543 RepID=A0A316D6W6_9BACL|nr:adenine deaminase C-terminal domain-containing protein [Tumebacillus permanentifrigoris]PWK10334.1 adenine deaminase [Tumebacillus permanentifrigoris]